MTTKGQRRTWIGGLLLLLLAVVVVGCGGSGGTSVPTSNSTPGGGTPGGGTPGGGTGGATSAAYIDANPGVIQEVFVGSTVTLDGSKTKASNSASVKFEWSFTATPDGSKATLLSPTSSNPTFIADTFGTYLIEMKVSADGMPSERAVSVIVAHVDKDGYPKHFHQGLSTNCSGCHDGNNVQSSGALVVPKSADHLATSNMCGACHSQLDTFATIPVVDHLEVFGKCSECHDGVTASGKSAGHVQTNAECDECHFNTTSWLNLNDDGSFDHSGITRACSSCHNGEIATGKTPDHPETKSECNACHNTVTFTTPFVDHTNITSNCVSCHDGVKAIGQTPDHPAIGSIDCVACHSKVTFNMGGEFDHSVIDSTTLPCATCHNGTNATGLTPDHIPINSSDCAMCHNTTAFKPAYIDHTTGEVVDHTGFMESSTVVCSDCHNGTDAIGESDNHVPYPAGEDCKVCHTPGTFTSGVFDHSAAHLSGHLCAGCHNGVISGGKAVDHIPTTEDCGACHGTVTFKDAVFSHTGIDVTNCTLCHGTDVVNSATKKPVNHLPTEADCSTCHNNSTTGDYTTFAGIVYDHAGITDNCTRCHDGVIANDKSLAAAHIPTTEDCSNCHVDTTVPGGFKNSNFFTGEHTTITRGCEGCHNGKLHPALGKSDAPTPPGHIPTTQDCNVCHNSSDFGTSLFNHTGIINNCVSCHDGKFASLNASGKSAAHPSTTNKCESCHNTTNFADAFVDHTSAAVTSSTCESCHNGTTVIGGKPVTGKNAGHIATTKDCGVCHEPGGSFAGAIFDHSTLTTERCDSCHGSTATGMSVGHVDIHDSRGRLRDCSDCHNTTAFAGAKYDHTGITKDCAKCHDGVSAPGKTINHVPTNQDCSVCHQTTGFLPATFDHTGIVDNCASCHDGVFATGKSSGHVATTEDCGVCHNTTNFADATFDHTGIVDGCSDCHNGKDAVGKSADHLATTLDCHFCHTTATFVGGTWDHTGITSGCSDCHDGKSATGKSSGHFVTTQECNVCHTTTAWAPASTFKHTTSDYPGDHNSRVTCSSCHTNNNEVIQSYRNSTYTGFCAACHERNYRSGDHGGRTVATNKDCGKSGCHRVSSRSF